MVFAALFLLCMSAFSPIPVSAANKVPTTRIIVPEEKPTETDQNTDELNTESPSTVPLDALPKTTPSNDENFDAESNEDKDEPLDNADAPRKNMPPPPIMRDFTKLPASVQRMRELILTAAKKGDIEGLRSLLGIGETATTVSIGGLEGDPIEYLKNTSGDSEGIEILAILIEVLEAGYVHMKEEGEEELFIWPYFYAWPLDKLTPPLKVELFRILTAGDLEDSEGSGRYIFYRVGINPDGQWSFFVAGD